MLLVIPLVVAPVMLGRRFGAPEARADRWRHIGAAVGVTLLTLAPWMIFNATRFERPVFISTNEGLTLYGANCPDTYFGPALGFWSINCALTYPMPADFDQSEKSVEFRRAGPRVPGRPRRSSSVGAGGAPTAHVEPLAGRPDGVLQHR